MDAASRRLLLVRRNGRGRCIGLPRNCRGIWRDSNSVSFVFNGLQGGKVSSLQAGPASPTLGPPRPAGEAEHSETARGRAMTDRERAAGCAASAICDSRPRAFDGLARRRADRGRRDFWESMATADSRYLGVRTKRIAWLQIFRNRFSLIRKSDRGCAFGSSCHSVKRHPELTPWRHEELSPVVGLKVGSGCGYGGRCRAGRNVARRPFEGSRPALAALRADRRFANMLVSPYNWEREGR
jgi:hypothetical protein